MNHKQLVVSMSLCGLLASSNASVGVTAQVYDSKTLAQIEKIYDLSEDAALTRLAKEYEAAVQARRVEALQLPTFAGAWFDSATQSLRVADSNQADFSTIERIGVTPVLVVHSLTELETARKNIVKALTSTVGAGSVRESYIDIQTNAVVLGVSESEMMQAKTQLAAVRPNVPVRLTSVAANVRFSTNLLGADGTQNYTWVITYGGTHPCSVGASAEEVSGSSYIAGFVTAGHCGSTFPVHDIIQSSAGTNLGTIEQSTFNVTAYSFDNNEDGAWVKTYSGWVPQPKVNGYTDGTLNVSGTWSGALVAPVGTTACRYGSISGGPHCSSISARNVTACLYDCNGPNEIDIDGLIKVSRICTEDGDSGGPLVTPANQVQGTVTGGTPNSCPDSLGDYVYFQPINTTLTTAGSSLGNPIAMLTSHGRSAPTISNYLCPDSFNSDPGLGIYACDFSSFDSQGKTDISWTASTGDSATVEQIFFRCNHSDPPVNLTLTVTNPYGTTTKHTTFSCP